MDAADRGSMAAEQLLRALRSERRRRRRRHGRAFCAEVMFALEANQLYDQAIALGEQGVQKFPEDESTAFWLAWLKLAHRGDSEAMLDYGRRFKARSDSEAPNKVLIARFVNGDIDGALAVRGDRQSDNPLTNAGFDAEQADLLQLLGRSAEARPLAARALATVRAAIAEGRPAPRGQVAVWYAKAAAIAALAGDREAATAWERQARAAPPSVREEQRSLDDNLADLHRFLGDPEAAWRLMAKSLGELGALSNGELRAFKPYYDLLYGRSPSYRAYMSKMADAPGLQK
jgi:tetratricopeptide (TPR) repeat protein